MKGFKGGRPSSLAASGASEAAHSAVSRACLLTPELVAPPHSWQIVPPDQSNSGHLQLLISTSDTIVTLDALDRIDQRISKGPFSHILLSPNGRFLALITASGMLWVVSADFSRSLSEVQIAPLGETGVPDAAEWCGDNAVALSWSGRVMILGPTGEYLRYDHSPSAILVGELDGLRVVSSSTCDFVQKVPDSTLAVFRPGSTHPAAILFEALEQFDKQSPKADESVQSIRPDLASAVDTCIEAAGRESDAHWQRKLLKAAQFGRAFLDLYDPTEFVAMAQTMKVLNAVRYFEIGIPITYDEYIVTPPSVLVDHLLSRNLHLLALRISRHLGLKPDPVLKHWAAVKIARSRSGEEEDEETCAAIVDKFAKEGGRGVTYADIARKAYEAGRVKLATMVRIRHPHPTTGLMTAP